MKNLMDTKIFRCMSRAGDLIVINLLMLLCSLPLVTMGAALAAAYDMSQRLLRGDEPLLVRGYFRAFRSNFRKATGLWLVFLGGYVVSVGDLFARKFLPGLGPVLTLAAGVQLVFTASVMLYAFPLQARYENTIRGTLKNAAVFSVCRLPYTMLMLAVTVSPFAALLSVPVTSKFFSCTVSLCVFIWFAGTVYLGAFVTNRLFLQQFHPEESGTQGEIGEEYILQNAHR